MFQGTVDLALIREQWDQLVRIAASLRHRTAPAHVVLPRLASSAPSDRLAKALTALGRALKSLNLVQYVHDIELRGRVQLQLNRGNDVISSPGASSARTRVRFKRATTTKS